MDTPSTFIHSPLPQTRGVLTPQYSQNFRCQQYYRMTP